jgi:hypothetical protein
MPSSSFCLKLILLKPRRISNEIRFDQSLFRKISGRITRYKGHIMRIIIPTSKIALALACASLVMAPVSSAFAQAKPAAAAPAAPAEDAPLKQIALTDKMIQNALAANTEINPILEKVPDDTQPDPKVLAQLDAIAKKHGFADYAEYDSVTENISLVMSGFDPETKKYVGQEAVLKKEIAQVQADKTMPAKDKKETLSELNDALKSITPIQFPGNTELVAKYIDKLLAAMPQDTQ